MDTSTIELLLGFTDPQVDSVVLMSQQIQVHGRSRFAHVTCPVCLKKCNTVNQTQTRIVRDMAIAGKEVYLHLTTHQFKCTHCQRFFYENFSFVDLNRQMTIRLKQYLYQCAQDSCLQRVSVRENVGWDVL